MPTVPSTRDLQDLTHSLSRALQDWSQTRSSRRLILTLQPPQAGDRYFQALTNPIHPTSASESGLLDLRNRSEDAYDVYPPGYFPHLSLMYSDLPKSELDIIAQQLSAADPLPMPAVVEIGEVWIVKAEGEVDTWRPVVKLALDGSKLSS